LFEKEEKREDVERIEEGLLFEGEESEDLRLAKLEEVGEVSGVEASEE
jgi:hypothetical protein